MSTVCKRNMVMQEERREGHKTQHHKPSPFMPTNTWINWNNRIAKDTSRSQQSIRCIIIISIKFFSYLLNWILIQLHFFLQLRYMHFRSCTYLANLSNVASVERRRCLSQTAVSLEFFYSQEASENGVLLTSSGNSMNCSMPPPVRVLV